MSELVNNLSMEEIIDFHATCSTLMEHQITEAGDNWLIVLNRSIGLQRIYKWASFVGQVIGEDFRNHEFKVKARDLSLIIQERFSEVGLDISFWSPVFFYLGMIYSYAKYIGFVKITHKSPVKRLEVLARLDPKLAETITIDVTSDVIFIDSRQENPISVMFELLDLDIIDISTIEIFKGKIDLGEQDFENVSSVILHQFHSSRFSEKQFDDNITRLYY